jgi:hypothetical protein
MKISAFSRYSGAVFAGYCAIMLTGQSPAYSAREETAEKPPSYRMAVAPLSPSNSSEQFSLKDWLSDDGSGGFPEKFSDENRVLDEWETIPADMH